MSSCPEVMRKSSSSGFIRNEARKKDNWWRVKVKLEKHRLKSRKYQEAIVGDLVRLLKKNAKIVRKKRLVSGLVKSMKLRR